MRAPAIPAPRSIAFVPPSDNETPPHHGTLPLTTTRRPILIHICRTGNDNHRPSRHGPFFIIRGQPADPSMDDARKQLWHDRCYAPDVPLTNDHPRPERDRSDRPRATLPTSIAMVL